MNGENTDRRLLADVAGMPRSCQKAIIFRYSVEDLGDPRSALPSVPRAVAVETNSRRRGATDR